MTGTCQLTSVPPCLITSPLHEPFLSSGGLQDSRHQALKATQVSQVNTAEVREKHYSKEPDAASFLINPEETLWELEVIVRKTGWFVKHVCLFSLTFKQSAKLVYFIQSCCLAHDLPKPELIHFKLIHGHLRHTELLVLHALASPFFLG